MMIITAVLSCFSRHYTIPVLVLGVGSFGLFMMKRPRDSAGNTDSTDSGLWSTEEIENSGRTTIEFQNWQIIFLRPDQST